VLAIRMQSSVKQDRPLGMLDQVSGYRQVGPTLSAFHQAAEIPGQPATGQGEEFHTQASLLNVAAAIVKAAAVSGCRAPPLRPD
jgi:hypothetical protein